MIHIGTSAQIAVIIDGDGGKRIEPMDTSHLRLMPYFDEDEDGQHLLVAASLNGGNVFTAFIEVRKNLNNKRD